MIEEKALRIDKDGIVFAELTEREQLEILIVTATEEVFLYEVDSAKLKRVGDLGFSTKYGTEIFKYWSLLGYKRHPIKMHCFGNYVGLVQAHGQRACVLDLEDPTFLKSLHRGDYHVEHCIFPIAFYEESGQTFLIHGTDWNRLDITCLETDEILTDRVVDYEAKSNYFDYFHSSLSISPDGRYFISNGWVWHPFGIITLYSVEEFLENYELGHKDIDLTDDPDDSEWDRPLCWIDNKTLAVGVSRNAGQYGKTNNPNEILFIDAPRNEIINRIEFDGFGTTFEGDVCGDLFYDRETSRFITLNPKTGLFVSDIAGKVIFADKNLTEYKYSSKHALFYKVDTEKQVLSLLRI